MKFIDCPLETIAQDMPNAPVIIQGNDTLTYDSLNSQVWQLTDYLHELGIRPSDRVAIVSPNNSGYLSVLYALWRLGAIGCLISPRLPEAQLAENLSRIHARYLITPLSNILTSAIIQVKKINLTQAMDQIRPHAKTHHRNLVSFDINQDATIIFTSGSCGNPKAVLHSFGNHFFSALGANDMIPFNTTHRWLLSLPLYHVGGLSILFRVLLGKGGIVLPQSDEDFSETILRHQVTHLSLVATQLFRILQNPKHIAAIHQCEAILLGGSAIPMNLIKTSIQHNLPIHVTYGLTEMSSQVATTCRIKHLDDVDSATILPSREVSIGEKNEIYARGKTLCKGYVVGNHVEQPFDNNGWFATGDIGRLDHQQHLTISGRKDNMFISGGENIRPEEIERSLCQLDAIEEAIVVPVPHAEFGFRPVAFIKERSPQTLRMNDIIATLQRRLPKFMTPDAFYAWPTKIEENSIKISRSRLRELVGQRHPDLIPLP
jgi:o-succinylbenzoate---CoA ligase